MVFFLKNSPGETGKHGQANVMHSTENSTEESTETSSKHNSGEATGTIDIEKTYRNYLKNTKNPIFVVDTEDKFIYLSSDFCDLLGTRCNILMGTLFLDYIHGKDLATFVIDQNKVIQNEKEMNAVGPYRISYNESEHLVLFDIFPVLEDGKLKYMVFGVKDITKKVKEMNGNPEKESPEDDKSKEDNDIDIKNDPRLMVDKNKLSYNLNIIDNLFR